MKTMLVIMGMLGACFGTGGVLVMNGKPTGANGGATPAAPDKIVAPAGVTLPDTWIGVRMTPAPEALAAHLGRGGLMVANVASGSPADKAGVERYDIVVSFNGEAIDTMEGLVDAISGVGAGASAPMVVLRRGVEQSLSVTPERRPDDGAWSFKYEEPEPDAFSSATRYFGHKLQRSPDGNWMFEPLGRLDLPDGVQAWLHDIGNGGCPLPTLPGLLDAPVRMRIDVGDPDGIRLFLDGDNDGAEVEIRIKASQDGETVTIERGVDGVVSVERVDADGRSSSATYDSLEQLAEADPDAYSMYRRYSGYRIQPRIMFPDMRDLPGLQWDFQEKLQRQLERTRQEAQRAFDSARRAKEPVQQHVSRAKVVQNADGASESMCVTNDNGRISVTITRDDQTETYEFDSREALEREQPDLYERVKPYLD